MDPVTFHSQTHLSDVYDYYYNRYKRVVYNRTYRRLSRYQIRTLRQEAEDLCQETFQSLYRWMRNYAASHTEFPSDEIFSRVLRTIEINEYRSYLKRLKPITTPIAPSGQLGCGAGDDLAEWALQSNGRDPEQELLSREYENQLHNCLKKLRSSESAALLCKLIGYSDKEIADLIGETEKKVMFSIIPLGRRKLRKCMEGYINGCRKR